MKGYKMWSQPYEHREYYVQSRSRNAPSHRAHCRASFNGNVAPLLTGIVAPL
jgi:hypothetical protein